MSTEASTLYLSAFLDELVRTGVAHIVVSPGSRSTPLAVLAAEHPDLRVWMHIDERSAGFFALGLAKARREAVAMLCTSGTAAANYMPAIAEAHLSRVPLIVLTADRPHELRDVGAPQTMDQLGLYGKHVKLFIEMPIPEASPLMIRHARITAARAVGEALGKPGGPVHLNFPLREPLLPDLAHPALYSAGRHDERAANTAVTHGVLQLAEGNLTDLASKLRSARAGLIICGPLDEPGFDEAVLGLADLLQFPVIADPLSQLRGSTSGVSHDVVVDCYDGFLRNSAVAEELQPDIIIRFGAMPVSKALLQYIGRHADCRQIVVDEGGWRDPALLVTDMVRANPAALCRQLCAVLGASGEKSGGWLQRWQRINTESGALIRDAAQGDSADTLFEGRIVAELAASMPSEAVLVVGNSMPIRDVDTFYHRGLNDIRILANRGVNGIDGIVSTAMGASAAGENTVLLIGDLSFYHDMNALLAAKLHQLSITIVLVNNDGGGIFSFLPQADMPRHFETLFGTPIGLDYSHVVHMFGGVFSRISSWAEFRDKLREAQATGGLHVIEVPTERAANVLMHRELFAKLSARLDELSCESPDKGGR